MQAPRLEQGFLKNMDGGQRANAQLGRACSCVSMKRGGTPSHTMCKPDSVVGSSAQSRAVSTNSVVKSWSSGFIVHRSKDCVRVCVCVCVCDAAKA